VRKDCVKWFLFSLAEDLQASLDQLFTIPDVLSSVHVNSVELIQLSFAYRTTSSVSFTPAI